MTGCYVSGDPEEAASLTGVDLVVPNRRKHRLVEEIHERFPESRPGPSTGMDDDLPYEQLGWGNSRGLVKIEDGCNVGCAFCIIPTTRGRQRSRPLPEVLEEVKGLARAGYREVILTGVQISHYRWEGADLFELVQRILAECPLPRVRLTSLAPWRFDRRLLPLLREDRVCRHVHLSLQSGAEATLERMGRPYRAREYRELVEEIRREVPGIAVTTDVIVGFPGETGEEFEESLAFVRERRFAKIHAFPYSERPGTPAADLPDPVPYDTKRTRMDRMLSLAEETEREFWASRLGEESEVLWEESRNGRWWGTTDHYVRVWSQSPGDLAGRLGPARLTGITAEGVRAEMIGA